jgi:hypothetical protein
MDTSRSPVPDVLAAIQSLTAAQILKRLDELQAERQSLQVLLRAARARESNRRPVKQPTEPSLANSRDVSANSSIPSINNNNS